MVVEDFKILKKGLPFFATGVLQAQDDPYLKQAALQPHSGTSLFPP